MSRCLRRLAQVVPQGRRTYAQAAVRLAKPSSSATVAASRSQRQPARTSRPVYVDDAEETEGRHESKPSRTHRPTETQVSRRSDEQTPQQKHLDGLFPGLTFSPDLARRILTHASHPAATEGHNGGLSFVGRRVLETYLLLLLSANPALDPADDLEAIASHALNTYLVGEHVGRDWEIGRVLRWVPAAPASAAVHAISANQAQGRSIGLYKVQGDTVAAVVGGVFREWGASTAHRLFHTRVVPHILVGLPDRFHAHVKEVCNRMGGLQGPLKKAAPQQSKVPDDGLVVTLMH